MRVHFNLVKAAEQILDPEGVEVVDLDHAYAEVKTAIAELIQENASMRHDMSGWRLDAVTANGALLFSINLDSVIN